MLFHIWKINISNTVRLARYLFIRTPPIPRKVVKIIQGPYRSIRQKVFCKKVVLRNFSKFAGKNLWQILFLNEVTGWGLQIYLKKTLAQVFSWNLGKFIITPFHKEHFRWLLQTIKSFKCSSRRDYCCFLKESLFWLIYWNK